MAPSETDALGDVPRSPEDRLLLAVLVLMDVVPTSRVLALRDRKITTSSTTFRTREVYELLDAVETVRPGLLDHYADLRTQSAQKG